MVTFKLKLHGVLRSPCRLGQCCPCASMDLRGSSGGPPADDPFDTPNRTGSAVHGSHVKE